MADEQNTNHAVATRDIEVTAMSLPATLQEMSLEQVEARVNKVRELQARIMKPGIHYGIIPGTPKPTLLKPGAELLCFTFMLDPQYEHEVKQDGMHREIISRCVLYHIPTNNRIASGEGSCSTYEGKYRWRYEVKCPSCGEAALMRSKFGRQGWYCNPKRGGCGGNFDKTDSRIKAGKQENPDIADQWNTVLKMSNKRSLTAACLNATAASEIFTQDVEDLLSDEDSEDVVQPEQSKQGGTSQPNEPAVKSASHAPTAPQPAPAAPPPAPKKAPEPAKPKPVAVKPDAPAVAAPPASTSGDVGKRRATILGYLRHSPMADGKPLLQNDSETADAAMFLLEQGLPLVNTPGKTPIENLVGQIDQIKTDDDKNALINAIREAGKKEQANANG